MSSEMNFFKRLKTETPLFFKRVVALSVTLSAVGAAILTAPNVVPGFVLSEGTAELCRYAIVAGIAAGVIGQSTMKNP